MKIPGRIRIATLLLNVAAFAPIATVAQVQIQKQAADAPAASSMWSTPQYWELTLSPYAHHFNHNPDHAHAYLIGLERHYASNWLWGAAFFNNSFDQPCVTAYAGYVWNDLFGVSRLYFKAVAGIMYGYVYPYEDKVPFNNNGWSPIVVPAVGWRFTSNDAVQLSVLGNAGLMLSYNRRF